MADFVMPVIERMKKRKQMRDDFCPNGSRRLIKPKHDNEWKSDSMRCLSGPDKGQVLFEFEKKLIQTEHDARQHIVLCLPGVKNQHQSLHGSTFHAMSYICQDQYIRGTIRRYDAHSWVDPKSIKEFKDRD